LNISVIIPLLNEEENIPILYRELTDVLSGTGLEYELIFVDDGSTDRSYSLLLDIQKCDDHLIIISFRRNFGQTAALSAGFDHARGDMIITMDADLQNDPRDIPKLIEKLGEGYDLINGWRFDRKDPFINRRLPSIIANWVISTTTHVKLHDYGCTLKAFRKEITQNIRLLWRNDTGSFPQLPADWGLPLPKSGSITGNGALENPNTAFREPSVSFWI